MPYKDPQKTKKYQRQYSKEWRKKNREKLNEYGRKQYWRNRDEIRKRKNQQIQINEQIYQIRARRYHRKKIEVLKKYGGKNPKCVCCGETGYEFLSIDHIIPKKGYYKTQTGENLYYHLAKNSVQNNNYQILCHNCNQGKRLNEVCPHKTKLFQTVNEWEQWAKCKNIKTPNHLKKLWIKQKKEF